MLFIQLPLFWGVHWFERTRFWLDLYIRRVQTVPVSGFAHVLPTTRVSVIFNALDHENICYDICGALVRKLATDIFIHVVCFMNQVKRVGHRLSPVQYIRQRQRDSDQNIENPRRFPFDFFHISRFISEFGIMLREHNVT